MREIKFRAWDGSGERMYPWAEITHRGFRFFESKGGAWVGFSGWRSPLGSALMQYTGLKDKNGKDIYHYDLLKNDQWPDNVVALVDWHDASWVLVSNDASQFINEPFHDCWIREDGKLFENFTVIGNSYENPELI